MRIAINPNMSTIISCVRCSANLISRWRKLALLAATLFLVAATSGVTLAQENYLDDYGKPAFSTPAPTQLGYVEQTNGHLHLEIPINLAIAQRGKLNTPFRIAYDSNIWTVGSTFGITMWSPFNVSGSNVWPDGGGWHILPSVGPGVDCWLTNSSACVFYGRADSEQTEHYFPAGPVNTLASDSSGYYLQNQVVDGSESGQVVYAPDGSLSSYFWWGQNSNPNAVTEDANGNYFSYCAIQPLSGYSYPQYGYCDTVGRYLLQIYDSGVDPTTRSEQTLFRVPNSQGVPSDYLVNLVQVNVSTHFQQSGVQDCTGQSCIVMVVSSITLPDSTHYNFKYDCDSTVSAQSQYCSSPSGQIAYSGELTQMTLPTGGQINYAWQASFLDAYKNHGIWLQSRTTSGGTSTYTPQVVTSCSSPSSVGCQQRLISTDPFGNTTTTTFTLDNGSWPTKVQGPLSTTNITWDFSHPCIIYGCNGHSYINKLAETETITSAGGASLTKQTKYSYDLAPGQTYTQDGLLTAVQEWGFYPGASPSFPTIPDRATYTNWYSPGNSPYLVYGGTNIHQPQIVTVCNNSGTTTDSACTPGGNVAAVGNKVSQTITTYDSPSPGLSPITGVVNHDDVHYPASLMVRGLATQVQKWVSGSTYLTSYFQYDATGQLLVSKDTALNQTTYDYTDKYFNDNGANPGAAVTPPGPTNAFLTKITLPPVNGVAFINHFGYYYGSGKIAYSTDFNLRTTYFHFSNLLDRLTSTVYPIGWSLINYTGSNLVDLYVPVADSTLSTNCTGCQHTQIKYDGLGRDISEQLVNDPGCASEVDTTYDSMGRVATKSHPYCYGSQTPVFETYAYDQLSRVSKVTHPDGQYQLTAFGNDIVGAPGQQGSAVTYGYGYPTLVTDEAGNQKLTWQDGLGRLIEVDEPSGTGTSTTPATGSVTIGGYEQSVTVGPPCILYDCGGNCIEWQGGQTGDPTTYWDQGWVSITVNGTTDAYTYGQGDTYSSVEQGLAGAINADPNAFVNASVSGTVINLTARVAGDTTDYTLSATSATTDTSGNFYSASFTATPSGPTLTGGTSPGSIGSSPNATNYTYDVNNNLVGVAQGVQTRTFSYDGASRLLSATNPESGTNTFTYDANSNLQTKTDARGIVTTMTYDPHNRVTQKTYSDTTPAVSFIYDISSTNGVTIQNPIGRLVVAQTSGPTYNYVIHEVYDAMGRSKVDLRWNAPRAAKGICCAYALSTNYNVAGEVIGDTNEFFSITPSYDTVGRLEQITSSLSDANHPGTLLSIDPTSGYTAAGAIAKMTYGNGLIETSTYNNRLQPTNVRTYDPNNDFTDVLNLSYGYTNSAGANNRSVTSFNSTATQIFMRTYTYDSLNRLATMSSPSDTSGCYGLSWTYDRYGNRLTQTNTGGSGSSCPQPSHGVLPNNRLTDTGFSYDAAGNMTGDNIHTYTYDAENRLTQVDGGATATYTYDAEGQRVVKTVGKVNTVYLRNTAGNVVAETDGGDTLLQAGYVYAGGSLLAEYENSTTYFAHKDHLGSTRLMTTIPYSNNTGDANPPPPTVHIYDSMDYLPYGEQIAGGTGTTHKFTGKERDAESGLDNFEVRFMSSSLGRFMSPDPAGMSSAHLDSPQTLNRYTYVLNNPINAIDPTGYECVWEDGSYDGEYDPDTGSVGKCQDAGGVWMELGQHGNWNSSANSVLQEMYDKIIDPNRWGYIGVSFIGNDGTPYDTVYDSLGRVILTAYGDNATTYAYYSPDDVYPNGPGVNHLDSGGKFAAGLRQYLGQHQITLMDANAKYVNDLSNRISYQFDHPLGRDLKESTCTFASITLSTFGLFNPEEYLAQTAANFAAKALGVTGFLMAIGGSCGN